MLRTLGYGFLRNINRYFQKPCNVYNTYHSLPLRLFLSSPIYCVSHLPEERTKIDVENNLRQACEEGDTAIILLMNTLHDFVIDVCREYRRCLSKQIEITEVATNTGPLSEAWDELPPYRNLEAELKKELSDYMTVFNTIGQMTDDNSLVFFIKGNADKMDAISVKYRKIASLLQNELEQNREIEVKLLQLKRESILKSVTE